MFGLNNQRVPPPFEGVMQMEPLMPRFNGATTAQPACQIAAASRDACSTNERVHITASRDLAGQLNCG
jgi:hypothetical protein